MPTEPLLPLAALGVLLAIAGLARHFATSPTKRNVFSALLVVLALVTTFLLLFSMGAWLHAKRPAPQLHSSAPSAARVLASASVPQWKFV